MVFEGNFKLFRYRVELEAVQVRSTGSLQRIWQSNLVLHNLDADTVSNHFAALLQRLNPADIHADRRIELECPSTGRNLRVSEHDTNLLTQLVDKNNDTI